MLTIFVLFGANYIRPLPDASVVITPPTVPAATPVALAWPGYGQSSLAAEGFGIVATHGQQKPLATASIAKVITALCVLEKYPLQPGEQGPIITMSDADVLRYEQQIASNGSRLYVETGEQLTEYQALQAIMLPSANNIADSLAIWAFGSLPKYQVFATNYVKKLGMSSTTIGTDASGLDPSTASTAADLGKLGLAVQANPVLSDIASQPSAVFPLVGTLTNYNSTLDGGFMTGIKTGNNDQNLGAFLYSARPKLGDSTLYLTGAVMGGPNLQSALLNGEALAQSAAQGFENYTYAREGTVVGIVQTKWGGQAPVITKGDLKLLRWKANQTHVTSSVKQVNGTRVTDIGTITLDSGPKRSTSRLQQTEAIPGPSVWWRLTRLPWQGN